MYFFPPLKSNLERYRTSADVICVIKLVFSGNWIETGSKILQIVFSASVYAFLLANYTASSRPSFSYVTQKLLQGCHHRERSNHLNASLRRWGARANMTSRNEIGARKPFVRNFSRQNLEDLLEGMCSLNGHCSWSVRTERGTVLWKW